MKNLTLNNIASAVGGTLLGARSNDDREVTMVTLDSRKIEEGGLFIATVGEKTDGHNYIKDVADKGAMAVICEKNVEDCNIPRIMVKDSFQALKDLAAFYRSNLDIPVVGITGSVGKTSTKEFIATVLGTRFNVLKTQGNFNNEVGMPLTVLSIRDEHEIAVIEMGISDFGEMTRLSAISRPDTCVITNIGQCHLENLRDRDGVLKAKTEMLANLNPKGKIFLNGDDDKLRTVKDKREPIFFGLGKNNEIRAEEIENKGLLGSVFTCVYKDERFRINVPLPGKHMVMNALAAAGVGFIYGLTSEERASGIALLKPTDGRSNVISTGRFTLIDDCYNANPVSMKAAIDLLAQADTRKVAILGDMFELGKNENELHYGVGEHLRDSNIDVLITVGNLSKNIFNAVKETKEAYSFDTMDEALNNIPSILKKDDSVLIKASHGMHFENILNSLKEEK